MREGGFKQIRPGPQTWIKRREAVTERLVGLANKETKIVIYEKGCPITTAGFKGGYRYPDSAADKEPDKIRPLKDVHSHPHDGLQYLCGGLKAYSSARGYDKIPTPKYSFQKNTTTKKTKLRKAL